MGKPVNCKNIAIRCLNNTVYYYSCKDLNYTYLNASVRIAATFSSALLYLNNNNNNNIKKKKKLSQFIKDDCETYKFYVHDKIY